MEILICGENISKEKYKELQKYALGSFYFHLSNFKFIN